jgi:hypothetical protein
MGYYDEEQWNRLPAEEHNRFVDDCFAYDDELKRAGYTVGGEALDIAGKTRTVGIREGKVTVTDGPYAEVREQIGGFFILEASDMDEAVRLVSRHPGVKAGPFEIRPVVDMKDLIQESERRRAAALSEER